MAAPRCKVIVDRKLFDDDVQFLTKEICMKKVSMLFSGVRIMCALALALGVTFGVA